ncbi:protein kinase [Streptomyces sparsogenes]|uniref:protein kinase domain-containing protein n=1 Tax=Streptomyces sparsogenes TaxID=67365 RepID=UPI0033EFB4F9
MEPGDVLDARYRLVRLLGEGGFGAVWRAQDMYTRGDVAIKIMHSSQHPKAAQRFIDEAITAGHLRNKHIVAVYGHGRTTLEGRDLLYLVMELLDGEPLSSLLENNPGPVPLAHALKWALQICDALAAAHRNGVVHRDIKPANVMIQKSGEAKVVDFGIAKNSSMPQALTSTGMVIGSFPYMAPERFTSNRADARSDLYSLGCLLFELCTGSTPFTGESPVNFMYGHVQLTPSTPSSINGELPPAVDELILGLLAKDPESRPGDATLLQQQILPILDTHSRPDHPGPRLALRYAAGSHAGLTLPHSQDSAYAGPHLLAVASGVGAGGMGRAASAEVISTLVGLDTEPPASSSADICSLLCDWVALASNGVRHLAAANPQVEGVGASLTALLWSGETLALAHIGSCRGYLLRDGVLWQMTHDHTWAQQMVDEGRITPEEAASHPQRSRLIRMLGNGVDMAPDASVRQCLPGDRYLLCSDGLSSVVGPQSIFEVLADRQVPQEAIQELIQLALRGGGPDNVTAVIADIAVLDENDIPGGLSKGSPIPPSSRLDDVPIVVGAAAESDLRLNPGPLAG